MAVVVSLICGVVAFLIYLPFIRIYDKKLVEQEKGGESVL
ncbi:PTS system, cellobiose-specific IIC component [Caldibacillus thermoamylovorans]|nr:PTS system, cellobiose-specific IIC component [Caldibacillus thermoamylovorans]